MDSLLECLLTEPMATAPLDDIAAHGYARSVLPEANRPEYA
ncbi:hypothetical protein AB0H00_00555 [Nocardia sp. NPDC023852]